MNLKSEFRKQISRVPQSNEDAASMRRFLYDLPEWKTANRLFIYVSVLPEPDTRKIISDALKLGKQVAVPKIIGRGEMAAVVISDLDELASGKYGLPEPNTRKPEMHAPELAIIPCLACDIHGNRLGHGGGYYDRFLSRVNCKSVCLCQSAQIFEQVPTDEFDVKPDYILTEKGIL